MKPTALLAPAASALPRPCCPTQVKATGLTGSAYTKAYDEEIARIDEIIATHPKLQPFAPDDDGSLGVFEEGEFMSAIEVEALHWMGKFDSSGLRPQLRSIEEEPLIANPSWGWPEAPEHPGLPLVHTVYLVEARVAGLPASATLQTGPVVGRWHWQTIEDGGVGETFSWKWVAPQWAKRQAAAEAKRQAAAEAARTDRCTERRRRRLLGRSLAASSEEAWWDEWHESLACWWVYTPWRAGLQACYGALGVTLAQHFDRFARLRGARAPVGEPRGSAEAGCEWLQDAEQLELPDFPDIGESFDFSLPPIPRLLPPLEQLQALAPAGLQHPAVTQQTSNSASTEWAPVIAGLVGPPAGAAGAALALGLITVWQRRRRTQPIQQRREACAQLAKP